MRVFCAIYMIHVSDCRPRRIRDAYANRRGDPPRKPLPAKRVPAQIRSLCRAYTGEAVRSLAAIMRQADAPPGARIQAIAILLDRGWGKPEQSHVGLDGGDLRIVIRRITESGDEEGPPLLLEHEPLEK